MGGYGKCAELLLQKKSEGFRDDFRDLFSILGIFTVDNNSFRIHRTPPLVNGMLEAELICYLEGIRKPVPVAARGQMDYSVGRMLRI